MVIAIDEFPSSGWPPGLTTRVDEYPGAIFSATKLSKDHTKLGAFSAYEESVPAGFKSNYIYEPNDDDMNTNIPRGPCSVQPDFWEFDYAHGLVVRHHNQPRKMFFTPHDVNDGPHPSQLRDDRVTIVHGSGEVFKDSWKTAATTAGELAAWTGMTCFFLTGVEVSKVKIPSSRSIGVLIKHAECQTSHWVHPSSLSFIGKKKILQFDLNAKNPIFEHAPSNKQEVFAIPFQQFGSAVVERRQRSRRDAREDTMAKSRQQDDDHVVHRDEVDRVQHGRSRDEASRSGTHGLCGEHDQVGDARIDDTRNRATLNDSSSGSDSEGPVPGVSRGHQDMSAQLGACSTPGQQAWQVSGMPELWPHQEGLSNGLRPADHQGDSGGLRHQSRHSKRARRQDHANQSRFQGLFGQLGRLLLTLIAVSFGGIEQQQAFEGNYDISQSSTSAWISQAGAGRLGECGHHLGRGDALAEPIPLRPGWRKRVQHCARRGCLASKTARDAVSIFLTFNN